MRRDDSSALRGPACARAGAVLASKLMLVIPMLLLTLPMLLLTLPMQAVSAAPSSPPAIPHMLRGTVTVDGAALTQDSGAVIIAKVDGAQVSRYTMGDMQFDQYFLYFQLNSTLTEGMQATITVDGQAINENPVTIGASGTEHTLDISVGQAVSGRDDTSGDSAPFDGLSGSSSGDASSGSSATSGGSTTAYMPPATDADPDADALQDGSTAADASADTQVDASGGSGDGAAGGAQATDAAAEPTEDAKHPPNADDIMAPPQSGTGWIVFIAIAALTAGLVGGYIINDRRMKRDYFR